MKAILKTSKGEVECVSVGLHRFRSDEIDDYNCYLMVQLRPVNGTPDPHHTDPILVQSIRRHLFELGVASSRVLPYSGGKIAHGNTVIYCDVDFHTVRSWKINVCSRLPPTV